MSTLVPIIICIAVAGFFGGSENGAYRLNRIRLRRAATRGSRLARLLERCVADMERLVCTLLAGNNAAVYSATILCTWLVAEHFNGAAHAALISTLILSPTLLVFAEVLPKSLFQAAPDRIMPYAAPALWLTGVVLWPVVHLLLGVVSFWRRLLGGRKAGSQTAVTLQHLSFMLAEGMQEGVITSQQDTMARNIMQFGARPVRKLMMPLGQVHMIERGTTGAEALQIIARCNRARLPVFENRRENVVGILLTLNYLAEGHGAEVRSFVRGPAYLDADLPVNLAFRRLQEAGQTMGIVTNPRGLAVGIITMGDLLQEILGTLEDA